MANLAHQKPDLARSTETLIAPISLDTIWDAETRFIAAFERGAAETFEDGMESAFSRELESLVSTYGAQSRDILARLFEANDLPTTTREEAMRWLGREESALSPENRLWLLEKGLTSSFSSVRDGAILGLASLNDPRAIPYLERAIHSETIHELREDMRQVLSQLKTRVH